MAEDQGGFQKARFRNFLLLTFVVVTDHDDEAKETLEEKGRKRFAGALNQGGCPPPLGAEVPQARPRRDDIRQAAARPLVGPPQYSLC